MKNDIEALRGFAKEVINYTDSGVIHDFARAFGLTDKDGNKTERLTGKKRSHPFHNKYLSLIRFAFNNWDVDHFKDFESFRKNIIILAGYYTETWNIQGNIQLVAKSIAFDKMSTEDFEKLYSRSIDVILKYILTNYNKADLNLCIDEVLRYA